MAEETDDDALDDEEQSLDDEDEEEATSGKKGLIIAIVAAVLLVGGGVAGYFLFAGDDAEETAADESVEEVAASEGDAKQQGQQLSGPVYYDMPEFLVNLSAPNNKPSFLKMKVTLELESQEDIQVIESYMPRIVDNLNTYLRELRTSDLAGSAGLYRLREELLMRINQFTAPTKVRNVLFKDIIVQ